MERQWLEAWEDFRVDAGSIATFGDNWVLVDSHQVARGAGSGIPVEMDVFWALEAVDGKLSRDVPLRRAAREAIEAVRARGASVDARRPPMRRHMHLPAPYGTGPT